MASMSLESYKSLVPEGLKKKNESTVAISAPFESKRSFSLLLWYLKLTAMAHRMQEPRSKAKSHNPHLLQTPKPKAEAQTLFPSHQSHGVRLYSHAASPLPATS